MYWLFFQIKGRKGKSNLALSRQQTSLPTCASSRRGWILSLAFCSALSAHWVGETTSDLQPKTHPHCKLSQKKFYESKHVKMFFQAWWDCTQYSSICQVLCLLKYSHLMQLNKVKSIKLSPLCMGAKLVDTAVNLETPAEFSSGHNNAKMINLLNVTWASYTRNNLELWRGLL